MFLQRLDRDLRHRTPHTSISQIRLGQVRLGQVRLGQVLLGQVLLGQVQLGQVLLGQVQLGQCQRYTFTFCLTRHTWQKQLEVLGIDNIHCNCFPPNKALHGPSLLLQPSMVFSFESSLNERTHSRTFKDLFNQLLFNNALVSGSLGYSVRSSFSV